MAEQKAIQTGSPKRLLSLDGGGVKGVSSLMILRAIMQEVQRIEEGVPTVYEQTKAGVKVATTSIDSAGERKPIDYFDLTGGTSTGGIMAVMLSRLDMNCTDALGLYTTLSSNIFAVRIGSFNVSNKPLLNKLSSIILGIKLLFGSQFSAKYLNQSIDQILKDHLPNGKSNKDQEPYLVDASYNNYDAKGKMFMCATMTDRGKALLFRDYTPPPDAIPETGQQNEDDGPPPAAPPYDQPSVKPVNPTKGAELLHDFCYNDVTIKEAVRATSAAPTYLPPEYIQDIEFWDGGLLNNNPIDQVWAARYDLAPNCHAEPYVDTIISLGCTYSTEKPKTPMGIISRLVGILTKTISFASNTEAKHMDFKRNIYRRNLRQSKDQQTQYFRFNAPVGDKAISLSDFQDIPTLESKTTQYLADRDVIKKVYEAACAIAKPRGEVV